MPFLTILPSNPAACNQLSTTGPWYENVENSEIRSFFDGLAASDVGIVVKFSQAFLQVVYA
jgi:hypothetical protein